MESLTCHECKKIFRCSNISNDFKIKIDEKKAFFLCAKCNGVKGCIGNIHYDNNGKLDIKPIQ